IVINIFARSVLISHGLINDLDRSGGNKYNEYDNCGGEAHHGKLQKSVKREDVKREKRNPFTFHVFTFQVALYRAGFFAGYNNPEMRRSSSGCSIPLICRVFRGCA